MLFKDIPIPGQDAFGINCRAAFPSRLEKTSSVLNEWDTADEIKAFLKTLTEKDKKENCYVLLNAMGAVEFYGSNSNADGFEWDQLAHVGDDYGHKTFLTAGVYTHHKNKEPEKSIGKVVVSTLNPYMKRVELVIALNRAKAKKEGSDGIITRIENGEFVAVSMGCKVKFDTCSICNHKSPTRGHYCEHMNPAPELRHKFGPNKVLPDGRKIFVLNPSPRFFDISFVYIGADKTAFVMAKLASKGNQTCIGDVCTSSSKIINEKPSDALIEKISECAPSKCATCSCRSKGYCCIEKLSSTFPVKIAAHKKLSDIIKEVPAGSLALKSAIGKDDVEDIDEDSLDSLADNHGIGSILSGLGSAGIILKPREFRRIVLIRMGRKPLANMLDSNDIGCCECDDVDDACDYSPSNSALDKVFDTIKHVIKKRSIFGGPIRVRMEISRDNNILPTSKHLDDPLLEKISAAYNGYRKKVVENLEKASSVIKHDPKFRKELFGDELVNMFSKTSSTPTVTLSSVGFALGAFFDDKEKISSKIKFETLEKEIQDLIRSF